MLYLNTFSLDTFKFTNRYIQYRNTLLESIYGCEFLQGYPDQGDDRKFNSPTPLFIADASGVISQHRDRLRRLTRELRQLQQDKEVTLYLKAEGIDRSILAETCHPKSKLSKYLELEVMLDELGDVEDVVQCKLEEMHKQGIGRVVFASSSRKDGKFFAFHKPDQWNDLLGSKAISHGNNLVSGNTAPPETHFELKVLLVDDDDKKSMSFYRLGDCHGVINRKLAPPVTRGNPFQYRGYSNCERWIFKGVLRPQNYTFGYDLILPLSSFKVDKNLVAKPLTAGKHYLPVTLLAVHKIAKSSWSSFGLGCQYFKSDASIEALIQRVRDEMDKLNALYVNGVLDVKSIAPILFGDIGKIDLEQPEVDVTELDNNIFFKLYQIIMSDEFGILSDHPAVINLVNKWFASKVKDISIRAALVQRYLLACPCDPLEQLTFKTVIVNDQAINDHLGLLSRFPLRNRNDIQPFGIVNLATVHEQVKGTDLDYWEQLDLHLQSMHYPADDRDIIIECVRALDMRYTHNVFWVSSSDWVTYGGDFDGDYGNIFPRSTMPELYDEALTWERLPETTKPPKNPLVGSIEELSGKATNNDIGLLSWCSTIVNCFADRISDADSKLVAISHQMQLAVDSFKSTHHVDKDLLEEWSELCGNLTLQQVGQNNYRRHWIRGYKKDGVYETPNNIIPTDLGDDTITQMVRVANELFVHVLPKAAHITIFRELYPLDGPIQNKEVYEFVGDYLTDRASLVKEYFNANGEPLEYKTAANGELIPLGTDDFVQYRERKSYLMGEYVERWNTLVANSNQSVDKLNASLWQSCHTKSKGSSDLNRSYLAFYILLDDVLGQLKRPRNISMELVNESGQFANWIQSVNLTFQGQFVHERKDDAAVIGLSLEYNHGLKHVGVIYSALPSRKSKEGSALMRYDRLRVTGSFPVTIKYLRQVGQTYRYEVVARLEPKTNERIVQGDDVAMTATEVLPTF